MTTKQFPASAVRHLAIRAGRGAVEVRFVEDPPNASTATPRPDASVTITPCSTGSDAADRAVVELRGDTLAVVAPRRGGLADLLAGHDRDAVDIAVSVAAGTRLSVSSSAAEVTCVGRSGGAEIAGGAGNVTVAEVNGEFKVRLGSGTVRAAMVTGSVLARCGSGDIHLGEVHGAVTASTGSGGLEVSRALGAVRARNGSGSVSLGEVHGDVAITSGSGPVDIALGAGVSARLDAVSGSGGIETALPVDEVPHPGGRRISVKVRTGSGRIRLQRAVPASA